MPIAESLSRDNIIDAVAALYAGHTLSIRMNSSNSRVLTGTYPQPLQ